MATMQASVSASWRCSLPCRSPCLNHLHECYAAAGRTLQQSRRNFCAVRSKSRRRDWSSAIFRKGHRQLLWLQASSHPPQENLVDASSISSLDRASQPLHELLFADVSTSSSLAPEQLEVIRHNVTPAGLNQRVSSLPFESVVTNGLEFDSTSDECTEKEEIHHSLDTTLVSIDAIDFLRSNSANSNASSRAKRLLDYVWESTNKIEDALSQREEDSADHDGDIRNVPETESKVERLKQELVHMKEELDKKDIALRLAAAEARQARNHSREAEALLLAVKNIKEEMIETYQVEQMVLQQKFSLIGSNVLQKHSAISEALDVTEEKVSRFTGNVTQLLHFLNFENRSLHILQREAQLSSQALQMVVQALSISEKRVEEFGEQIDLLEEQVKLRDILLDEIKEETVRSTEALKVAAQIKQDLNLSREREVELTQELEGQVTIVKELRHELHENSRAVRAEQALRQMEKNMRDLAAEVDILHKGVQTRDEAMKLMKDEMDRNIHIISNAAENREIMRKMQLYINDLEAELKDAKLLMVNREVSKISAQEQSTISK